MGDKYLKKYLWNNIVNINRCHMGLQIGGCTIEIYHCFSATTVIPGGFSRPTLRYVFMPMIFRTSYWPRPTSRSLLLLMVQKSSVHQLSLVVYPIIYKVLYKLVQDFWTINSSRLALKTQNVFFSHKRRDEMFLLFEYYTSKDSQVAPLTDQLGYSDLACSKSHIPPFFRGSSLVATWKSHAMHHFWLSPGPALNSTGSKTVVKAFLGKAIMWEIGIYRNIYEVFLPFYPYNPTQKLYYLKYFERLTGPFSRVQSPPRQESFGL